MLEAFVSQLHLEDPGAEEPAATRDRLRDAFPRGATRRMTQLGLLVGSSLLAVDPAEDAPLLYLSAYGETRALEGYLESFPTASPTLFQTSIHPSAVEQALIAGQRPVREFWPMTGSAHLVAQGLTAALLNHAPRVVICGGEERGTWLLKQAAASERTFAFAFTLTRQAGGALAHLALQVEGPPAEPDPYPLPHFFDDLSARRSIRLRVPSGGTLSWTWL